MLDRIISNTREYTSTHNKGNRKDKGQFFTSVSIAEFMAMKAAHAAEHLSILEPGAGNGILTATLIKYCVENELCNSFDIKFVENDFEIIPVLESTSVLIKEYVSMHQGAVNISISTDNYITVSDSRQYDVIICNPPYMKIRKDSAEAQAMQEYVYGQPNLYGLFMCKAVNNLKKGGRFVFITPRSWTSGNYFKSVRKFILDRLNLTDLLLFENRDNVFNHEDVLQETLITSGTKEERQAQFIYLYNADGSLDIEPFQMEVPSCLIKSIGADSYLLLPKNEEDIQVIQRMSAIPDTFESLGYCFKTGPVVEFRNKASLSTVKKNGYIPMYRTANIINGRCVFPANTDKAQYISVAEKKLLLSNVNTVLLRRLSAKEENRRLQSCVYYQTGSNRHISVENHVNYLVRLDGQPLSADEAEWINKLLMSDDYDIYYRVINGNTQVNAGEMNKLPLQRRR